LNPTPAAALATLPGAAARLDAVRAELAGAWLGDPFVLDLLLVTMLAGGHLLLEDVPGVGKTTLAKALARALGVEFRRVQFTNDLLPADVLGGSVYHPGEGRFEFVPGPVFTELLLADEVNRAPTRSQSAFLQAMEEGQVSVDGVSHPLPALFTVIATQNPIDYDSTNPLPEAQLDRFLIATRLGYPGIEDELALLHGRTPDTRVEAEPVLAPGELLALRAQVGPVHLHPDLAHYIVTLARATREDARLRLGISPRGALHLAHAARALALLSGRGAVLPEDVQRLVAPVWTHRLLPRQGRDAERSAARTLLAELLASVPVPR
jgi:MoxR-like ATPase